ncbi:MAG: hypothetical protein BRC56_01385 [Cyanobacteria bacterium SW_9_47_5]|nr:MAG: hypothetical protein BRC56_01385 [Cyanobacteria bacterium SW_9_47_5]
MKIAVFHLTTSKLMTLSEFMMLRRFYHLRDQRLERGRGLLEPRQMNIQEVATTVGYASQSRFCHAFKRKFGVTPRSYCKIPQIEPRHV